jgi:hypothetical protein
MNMQDTTYISSVHFTHFVLARVEAGSYTSNVALRVVVGDEKRTQCLGV